jgi:hypothetical protein
LSCQTLLALPFVGYGTQIRLFRTGHRNFAIVGMIFGAFLLVWGGVAWTGLGVSREVVGWNRLGAPILETQVLLAWLIGIGLLSLGLFVHRDTGIIAWFMGRKHQALWIDLSISLLLWAFAALLWHSVPLTASWFSAPPRPPNYAFYPNSDASVYDTTAQSMLAGEGFKSWGVIYAIRPMYALYLAGLHALAGLDYQPVINWQVATLALFPVFLYWLARSIHNRLAGVFAACLAIFREANAISLASVITVSNSKMLMSDVPTAWGVILFVLVAIAWLKKPNQRGSWPLLAGGILGAFMLIRPEVGIFLPVIGLVAVWRLSLRSSLFWKSMVALLLGTGLVLVPWIGRNYQLTGKIFLDSPNYRADLIEKRYNLTPTPDTPQTQPENPPEEIPSQPVQDTTPFVTANTVDIVSTFLNHFLNSQVQTVLYLPLTFRLPESLVGLIGYRSLSLFWQQCCSANDYVRSLPFWWDWNGQLPSQVVIPLLIDLLLLATGLFSAWQRQKVIGLIPLVLSLAYFTVHAAVRDSGGRYILPVDWVGIFYYSIGLAQLSVYGFKFITNRKIPPELLGEPGESEVSRAANPPTSYKRQAVLAAGILLFGSILPISEKAVRPIYTDPLLQARLDGLNQWMNTSAKKTKVEALQSIMAAQATPLLGRALYPRFHKADHGEAGDTWASFIPRPYPRFSFYMVGTQNEGVVLPYKRSPNNFPNGSDVLVLGCDQGKYFNALAVILYAPASPAIKTVLIRSPFPDQLTCPLVDPG